MHPIDLIRGSSMLGTPKFNRHARCQYKSAAAKIMSQSLFLFNVAEIQISYSSKVKPSDRQKITCSKDAAEILRQIFSGFEHQGFFYILTLNRANRVLGYFDVSK